MRAAERKWIATPGWSSGNNYHVKPSNLKPHLESLGHGQLFSCLHTQFHRWSTDHRDFHIPQTKLERFNWDLVWAGEEGRELLSGDFRPQKSLPSSKFQVTNLISAKIWWSQNERHGLAMEHTPVTDWDWRLLIKTTNWLHSLLLWTLIAFFRLSGNYNQFQFWASIIFYHQIRSDSH